MLNDGTVITGASVSQILTEELGTLKATIINNIRATGQWASGKTAASMAVMVSGSIGELVGRRAFGTLETGRRGGRVPRNFHNIIYDWMQAKGVHADPMPYKTSRPHKYTVEERSLNMAAGAIAHTIETTGTRLYKQGGRHDIYSDVIAEEVAELRKQLAVSVAETLSQTLSEGYKSHAIGDATYQHLN